MTQLTQGKGIEMTKYTAEQMREKGQRYIERAEQHKAAGRLNIARVMRESGLEWLRKYGEAATTVDWPK